MKCDFIIIKYGNRLPKTNTISLSNLYTYNLCTATIVICSLLIFTITKNNKKKKQKQHEIDDKTTAHTHTNCMLKIKKMIVMVFILSENINN